MKSFVILPDVTCDLGNELRQKYDIEYIRGHISYPDGTEQSSFLDWKECAKKDIACSEDFYAQLKKDPKAFTTSPPNIDEYAAVFEKYAAEGVGVLSMSISSALSATYNFSLKGREAALEKYPDAEIYCLDTRRFSTGFGLMAIFASQLRAQGKTLAETAEILEKTKNTFHQAGWLDDLSFVASKGRITHAQAFFGRLVGVKPIGEFDYNGLTTVLGKAIGEKAAYDVLLRYMEETIVDASQQVILIAQTNRRKQAETYKKMIEERFRPKEVVLCEVFAACGINVGPGLMAAYYTGKPISENLTEERALMEKLLK